LKKLKKINGSKKSEKRLNKRDKNLVFGFIIMVIVLGGLSYLVYVDTYSEPNLIDYNPEPEKIQITNSTGTFEIEILSSDPNNSLTKKIDTKTGEIHYYFNKTEGMGMKSIETGK